LKGIILDENIPARLTFTPSLPVIRSSDFGRGISDTVIWERARAHSLVILTKDADFSNRMLVSSSPPWIVRLRFGNMRKRDFHSLLAKMWSRIEILLPEHKLINVYPNRIEGIKD
jgi:predicted nuclease of predicted toxin-antitoxin system